MVGRRMRWVRTRHPSGLDAAEFLGRHHEYFSCSVKSAGHADASHAG